MKPALNVRKHSVVVVIAVAVLIVCGTIRISGPSSGNAASKPIGPAVSATAGPKQWDQAYAKLPMSFEANSGQSDADVQFLSRGHGYSMFLTSAEAVLVLSKTQGRQDASAHPVAWHESRIEDSQSAVLRMRLRGAANTLPQVSGEEELPGKSNYFIGDDRTKWRTNVPTYAKVRYSGVYSGIDLLYYGNGRELEYDFVVAPGADPGAIRLAFGGTSGLTTDRDGDLVLKTETGGPGGDEIRFRKPVVYQLVRGRRQEVAAEYMLSDADEVSFKVGRYDVGEPLVIDPILSYSTYLGGSSEDHGWGIAVDGAGNAYVTGYTASTNFPTASPLQPANGGGAYDAYVAKLNAAGSALLYSTYLGGNSGDWGYGIAVDGLGNAYVTGYTASTNFPTASPLQPANGGSGDAFVAKLNAAGSALLYSTYLGGNSTDAATGIAVDGSGNAYVTGGAGSNFPLMNPLQPAFGGGSYDDAFVAKLSASGSALLYSTYLGGNSDEYATAIAVDGSGNVYLTGLTSSTNFPAASPLQPANGGGQDDAFVAKLNAAGSALLYSTYLGGNDGDQGHGIAVDGSGNAYVTGTTRSANFPTASPLQPATGGLSDAFVAKLNAAGSALLYSTYLGGADFDLGYGIAVDGSGNAYVTGRTGSTNFPTASALQPADGGGGDAFVAKLNASGSTLLYSTYLGGNSADASNGIAVDGSGNAYLVGDTASTNFPTASPLQPAYSGGAGDAFVAKISSPAAIMPNLQKGDLDGDGKADIVFRNTQTGDVAGWLMNGLTIKEAGVIYPALSSPWQIAGIGDLNADGKADLLFRNSQTGDVSGWLMNGLTISQAGVIYPGLPFVWAIAGIADLDGDGKADLAFRNSQTGDVAAWLMNGLAIKQATVVYPGLSAVWQMQ